jgi:hypothetical protein
VEAHLPDHDAQHAHVAERAFLHLQRLIVADPYVRRTWQEAFESGEVECEGLGGCHLLHHGIYGVKANSAGERTDLILGTKLVVTSELRRAADAMAVTEWKLVRDASNLDAVLDGARNQLARYTGAHSRVLKSRRFASW